MHLFVNVNKYSLSILNNFLYSDSGYHSLSPSLESEKDYWIF